MSSPEIARATYLLPVASEVPLVDSEWVHYLRWLGSQEVLQEVLVVDGSPPSVFSTHKQHWGHLVNHVAPSPEERTENGKVGSVMSGVLLAPTEKIIVADDDVRYDEATLKRVCDALCPRRLIRPQNVFSPMPWHAWWDSGRSLVHRAIGGDWTGTLAFRRSDLLAAGGYRGDVMFENLELAETLRRRGVEETVPLEIIVGRVPPSARQFLRQRVRHAYDEFARPPYLIVELGLLPFVVMCLLARRKHLVALASVGFIAMAEVGRRRGRGRSAYPWHCVLAAPCWALERSVCAWLAVICRFRGGVPYRDRRLRLAASLRRWRL